MSQILSTLLFFVITKPLSESVIVISSCFPSTRVKDISLKLNHITITFMTSDDLRSSTLSAK